MGKSRVDDIRNVALVGHGAVGKTTLADLMLFRAGVGSRTGSVDDGTSVLDFDEEEKHHKFSISSSLIHFQYEGKTIQVLDTPGYPDFIGQVIGALRAVETAAVVINANSGIEVNTVPGLTDHSLVPKAAGRAGLTLGELCEHTLRTCLETVRERRQRWQKTTN